MEKIAEGAESQIFKISENKIKKIRTPKTYRLKQIDEKIRKFRNRREFKILNKLYENKINVPEPFEITDTKEETSFTQKFIEAKSLKESLNKTSLFQAFKEIIKIHNLDISHGDLTTLNMLEKTNKSKSKTIYIIDFGLSEFNAKHEEKATDLNLFFSCIKNEHPEFIKYKEELIENYKKKANNSIRIIKRLEEIEQRGRNK